MGNLFAKLSDLFSGFNRQQRVLMLGLDASGKTTILYKLKLNEHISSVPTIGFNTELIEYKHLSLTIWDVGGQAKIRPLWRHYYHGTDALIFVVDSSDTERLNEAAEELNGLLSSPELDDAAILVYANKQDLPNAADPHQLVDRFGLNRCRGRKWFVQPSVACNGDGLYEGLDWLSNTLRNRKYN